MPVIRNKWSKRSSNSLTAKSTCVVRMPLRFACFYTPVGETLCLSLWSFKTSVHPGLHEGPGNEKKKLWLWTRPTRNNILLLKSGKTFSNISWGSSLNWINIGKTFSAASSFFFAPFVSFLPRIRSEDLRQHHAMFLCSTSLPLTSTTRVPSTIMLFALSTLSKQCHCSSISAKSNFLIEKNW